MTHATLSNLARRPLAASAADCAAVRAAGRRRGFSLAEVMVAVGIILLVLVIALPAFTAIVGSRGVESARNVVAAAIVRARGEAIRRGAPCGVFFYVDPDTGRAGAAIVTLDPLTDPDPYDEYKSFARTTTPRLGHTLKPVLEDALDRTARFLLELAGPER